jgi:fucose permease
MNKLRDLWAKYEALDANKQYLVKCNVLKAFLCAYILMMIVIGVVFDPNVMATVILLTIGAYAVGYLLGTLASSIRSLYRFARKDK